MKTIISLSTKYLLVNYARSSPSYLTRSTNHLR